MDPYPAKSYGPERIRFRIRNIDFKGLDVGQKSKIKKIIQDSS